MMRMPLTFVAAAVLTIAVTIFFGAWAVSADGEARERGLAFALSGTVPPPLSDGGSVSGLDQAGEANSEDTWWGKAVLKACPFH